MDVGRAGDPGVVQIPWTRGVPRIGVLMIFRFFHRFEWALAALSVVLSVLQIWMDMLLPEYMEVITDSFLQDRTDVVMQNGIRMLGVAALSVVLSLAVGFVVSRMAASVGRNMRLEQFDRVQSFSMADIDRFSASSLITRSTNDVYQVQNFIARGMQAVVKAPIMGVWAVSRIYSTNAEWLAIVVAGLLAIVLVSFVSLRIATPLFRNVQWFTDGVNRSTRESLDGIRVIRAYNAEGYQEARFDTANDRLLDNNIRATRAMMYPMPFTQAVNNFIILGVYWAGAGIILSAGYADRAPYFTDMIVITTYTSMVISAFMMILGIFRMLPRAMVGMRRIDEVVDTEPSVKDGTGTAGAEGHAGEIEFRDVSFAYPGADHPVLENVSFRIDAGTTFAIIGSTGSGKTTVVDLMMRFFDPTSGEVLVDGRDVREYEGSSLHRRLGYVPQTAIIFSGTVADNVNYGSGSEDRTEEDIRRALSIAQADFVYSMPDGLGSHISQHGRNLSGGQKQRISIARAVCRDPGIYILDDAFSALDFKTDRALRAALRKETAGSTVVIVAQRIGTIRDADRILVLDEGRAVGIGTHDELMEGCRLYREIARSQLTEEELS